MQNPNAAAIKQNGTVLSNATALAHAIIAGISEQHISKTLNDESLTRDKIEHLVVSKLTSNIIDSI